MATPHFLHLLGRAVWATHANCEAASWPGERHRACRLALQWSGCRHGCIAQARRFHEAGCACRSGLVAGVIAVGSVIGPVLLMFGLAQTSASTVATALIAWFVSARISYRVLLGMSCLFAGATVPSWSGQPTLSELRRLRSSKPVSHRKTVALAISFIPRLLSSLT